MPNLKEQEQFNRGLQELAEKTSRLMAAEAKQQAGTTFARRTGKLVRSHAPVIKKERSTGDVYAFGVRARSYGFILAHGQSGSTRKHTRTNKNGTTFTVRSHKHRIDGNPYIFRAVAKYAPRIAQDVAKLSAKAIVKTSKYIENAR